MNQIITYIMQQTSRYFLLINLLAMCLAYHVPAEARKNLCNGGCNDDQEPEHDEDDTYVAPFAVRSPSQLYV